MKIAITALLLTVGMAADLAAQSRVRVVDRMPAPPVPPIPQIHPVIPTFGQSRCHGPMPYGYGYRNWGYGGYGGYYGPGIGVGYGMNPWGWGGVGYTSVSYGVPGLSVGYVAPLSGIYGYGYDPYGGIGYGTAFVPSPLYTNPTPQLEMPQWVWDESGLGNGGRPVPKTAKQTHPTLIPSSTPEAQLRSARLQEAGDRLFQKLDYFAAEKSYTKSMQAAPDRPEPYVRLAMAKAARGDLRAAVSYLKQVTDVDSTYPARADSLGELFGPQNGVARLRLKQQVADWANVDVRDPDRLYLLGVVLFLEGDDRFKTILDTAVKLEGEKSYLMAFVNAPPANAAPLVLPASKTDTPPELEPTPVAGPRLPDLDRPPLTVPVPEP
jgi:hypothetical protein